MALTLTSPAFASGGSIPARFTCDGDDDSPPLAWTGVPSDARCLVLIVDDPDAPDPAAPKTTWVHWVVYNLPPTASELEADAARTGLPAGVGIGRNGWGRADYGGPCPPIGRHRYFHKLYALDAALPSLGDAGKEEVEAAMEGHVLERAELVGTYQRARR
jgi:Raf kinase inhibitor-like YbhB/YbcL family protein